MQAVIVSSPLSLRLDRATHSHIRMRRMQGNWPVNARDVMSHWFFWRQNLPVWLNLTNALQWSASCCTANTHLCTCIHFCFSFSLKNHRSCFYFTSWIQEQWTVGESEIFQEKIVQLAALEWVSNGQLRYVQSTIVAMPLDWGSCIAVVCKAPVAKMMSQRFSWRLLATLTFLYASKYWATHVCPVDIVHQCQCQGGGQKPVCRVVKIGRKVQGE